MVEDGFWTSRSMSLLKVVRLDIGLKLEGRFASSVGFLSSGVIWAVLKEVGNMPWRKERLAVSMRQEAKRSGQDLRKWDEMMSMGEDLAVWWLRIRRRAMQ